MKKYLNKQERNSMLFILNLMDRVEEIIMNWTERGNLTKEEKKNLKTSLTFAEKGIKSIIARQDISVIETLWKEKKKSGIILDMRYTLDVIAKKKSTELDGAYEDNKEYFKLIELIMHYNCRGCVKECGKCEFFKEFEEQRIPTIDEAELKHNCKFSY